MYLMSKNLFKHYKNDTVKMEDWYIGMQILFVKFGFSFLRKKLSKTKVYYMVIKIPIEYYIDLPRDY